MLDIFTFPDSPKGHRDRAMLSAIYWSQGRTTREFEEDWTSNGMTTHVLRLEVGKRKDEGQIARDMKARKQ